MPEYQVLARKYRPQCFGEVVGQEAIITTLKNAIRHKRLAHAYLFCGSRGTGKTSVARILAKALNCPHPREDYEPCNACPSCREIAVGTSLDVLEIDGASHRGIDDVRQINETVGYAPASGRYKIYIIDEVHMLTKEAFNALLKTLEEPPAMVKFFFATTEPHKVPPTIISRCQRFNLNRIGLDAIVATLARITEDLKTPVEREALQLIAHHADGGLRDAESILDQILAFSEGPITAATVADILAITPKHELFAFDQEVKKGNLAAAFTLAHSIFCQGKDMGYFVESLIEHYRNILLLKVMDQTPALLTATEEEFNQYRQSAQVFSAPQCLAILDLLMEAQGQLKFHPNKRVALEAILLRVMRSYQRIPVEYLVRKLTELEQALGKEELKPQATTPEPPPQKTPSPPPPPPKKEATPPSSPQPKKETPVQATLPPTAQEISKLDTLLQFAKVELDGTIEKK